METNNSVIMQYFEWYLPDDGNHWNRLRDDASHLSQLGITHVWMPPAQKSTGTNDVGYGVYDLYDLGEFDQKGNVRTKYGTKEEYLEAIQALKEVGIRPIADIVLNHRAAGDEKEAFNVLKMNPENRQEPWSEPYEIEGYTYFTFPGRKQQYSDFKWHWYHFSGLDYDAKHDETGVFMILGDNKGWANNENVDNEKGNFDYLMFNDIDYRHPEVVEETFEWLTWFLETTQVDGFRLDAVKHIDQNFMSDFIEKTREQVDEDFFIFAEYWRPDYESMENYLEATEFDLSLIDVKLHQNFYEASQAGRDYHLSEIFSGSLVESNALHAVTFVNNHDTQQGQSFGTEVSEWFRPLAYAIILLIDAGVPTVFYGDYYGTGGEENQPGNPEDIDALLFVRKHFAYGETEYYLDHANTIGWVRYGDDEHLGCAVVMSNGDEGEKKMSLGELYAGKTFVDALGHREEEIQLDEKGTATFMTNAGSVSVWVEKEAYVSIR